MKYLIIALTIVALATTGWIVYANPFSTQIVSVVDLYDQTDPTESTTSTYGIIEKLGIKVHPRNGCTYTGSLITDVDYNNISTITLPSIQNPWLYSPIVRDKEVQNYIVTAHKKIEELRTSKIGYERSSIYVPVIKFANKLANENSDNKILILHSNGYEHSSHFSFYRSSDLELLKQSPKKVIDKLKAVLAPKVLSGLVVYILYKPVDQADSDLFDLSSGLLKSILETAGAKVYIQANLSSNLINSSS